jgi:phosphoglycerate dehydrogenase-like enzyme
MTSRTIFCDTAFPQAASARLTEGVADHRLLTASDPICSNLIESGPDPQIAQAEIAFGQPDVASLLRAQNLRWLQLTSAGYGRYDQPAVQRAAAERGLQLTTSSTVYALPCAEHLLALMLAAARRLPDCLEDQRARAWPDAERRQQSFLLRGQRVVLLGFGAIAQRLVELLAPFECTIVALRRSPQSADPVRTITVADLDEAIRQADHVINVLPGTSETERFVDAARFRAMAPTASLYNVGRGTTVDQDALLDALHSGGIAGAYLDVTDPEPLPTDHPLWTAPHCYLTPHSAGGRNTEHLALVEHFLANLDRFERSEPLLDRVL